MRKKLLFIMNNLDCGGAEKALVSLLETIDYDRYEVDLFLFKHHGLFFANLPKQVRLLEEPPEYAYFDMSLKQALTECLKRGKIGTVVSRAAFGYIFKTETNRAVCDQRVWPHISRAMKPVKKKYDAAIAYLEKNPIYYCVDKIDASVKIGFIHNDYDKLGMDAERDLPYFKQLDRIVTVSDQCAQVLKNRFPAQKNKIDVMYNIVSPAMIHQLAESDSDAKLMSKDRVNLVSVGRLVEQKGFDMAVEACKELIRDGYPVTWYVIGEGENRAQLEEQIARHQLQDVFVLLGIRENPYPFLRQADVYVQPSRFEGKSIALDEAKILHKPIVVTNYSTVHDQIEHEKNGYIVDMNATALSEGIRKVVDDEALRNKLVRQLQSEKLGTEAEIDKLYEWVG
ncbi:glycosyltransferase [Paenibacillus chartarius]|uniref:Glycosyltransferase n=1 Tax=Paenibacillus chartarius TaxID=747481 RepID=A0ABV6DUY1_9BACL